MGSTISSLLGGQSSPESVLVEEKSSPLEHNPSSPPETTNSTSGLPPTFTSDLELVLKSSRKVYSSEPEPVDPLPKCFYDFKADDNGKGFKFDFQWSPREGAVIHVTVVDEKKYPTAHKWNVVEVPEEDVINNHVTRVLDKQKEWRGLSIREMLEKMSDGFWGRG